MKRVALPTKGFSVVEVIVAASIFALTTAAVLGVFLQTQRAVDLSQKKQQAVLLAEEGLEAVRNIRDQDFLSIPDGTFGLVLSSNQWTLSGTSDTTDSTFTRQTTITSIDSQTKEITSEVSWGSSVVRSTSLSTILTDWDQQTGAPINSCDLFCQFAGYASGQCVNKVKTCQNQGGTPESGGDLYCTQNPSKTTCCCTL